MIKLLLLVRFWLDSRVEAASASFELWPVKANTWQQQLLKLF